MNEAPMPGRRGASMRLRIATGASTLALAAALGGALLAGAWPHTDAAAW